MIAPRVVLIALLVHVASATSQDDDDAVVIEADGLLGSFSEGHKAGDWRRARANSVSDWPSSILPPGPCFSNQGRLGRCTTFRQCYPYFKLPDLSNWETWVLGVYDTCSYFSDTGRQMFGVCCTLPSASAPVASAPIPVAPVAPVAPAASVTTAAPTAVNPPYPINPIPPNWPPPLPPVPTHPPDHTAATHPPSGLIPAKPYPPTTPAPATTSKKPLYPIPPNWPPTIPTHPPVTKPPVPTLPTLPTRPTTTSPRPTIPGWPPKPTPPQKPSYPPTKPQVTPAPPTQPPPSYDGACGYQDQERIVGGQNADIGEWPWIAALFNGGRQFCGGSLIDSTHILTAAHCVAHMSSWDVARLTVRLGDHNIKTGSETRHIEKRVRRVVRHRGFDSRTLYNDVALLTLDSPVSFRREIRPICLPAGSAAYTGLQATVIGWGSLRESGPQPAVLQEVTIPVWSNTECRLKYGAAAPGGIVESFLCAGQASRDSCSGDSGGPLMVNDGKWTQVGIVSWGIGCGKGQYPGVYTRVTSFMPWIRKNLVK